MPDSEGGAFPTEVGAERTWFDRLADWATEVVANASFFVACIAFVLLWLAFGAAAKVSHLHEWSDALAVPAAGVTLIMVALLQNEERRNYQAVQRKLNAMSDALAELMERMDVDTDDAEQLRAAVGLEHRESTND